MSGHHPWGKIKSKSELRRLTTQHPVESAHALAALQAERDEARRQLAAIQRREPNEDGGPGHEELYWLRQKLDASVQHLRDIEDFYRLRGGSELSHNMVRADRARSLYEQITEDFVNGKLSRPTMRQERDEARADRDELRNVLAELKAANADLEAKGREARAEAEHLRALHSDAEEHVQRLYVEADRLREALEAADRRIDVILGFGPGAVEAYKTPRVGLPTTFQGLREEASRMRAGIREALRGEGE